MKEDEKLEEVAERLKRLFKKQSDVDERITNIEKALRKKTEK
ncbi:MAG: hypothetical protein NWE89_01665 [Candidatus Bathyarchaeota archaeon]|nr:hypothetical protein [Candidatus Bathyarchaeota archaeon]